MGWANGSDIFDAVCQEVIDGVREQGLEPVVATDILTVLIRELQNLGWDCEYESLVRHQDWLLVLAAFARQGVRLEGEDDEYEA